MEALFPVLNRMMSFERNGKKVKAPAFHVALELCAQKALRGDAKASIAMDRVLQLSGYFDASAEERQASWIVVSAPAASTAEWVKMANATYMAVDPLEGVPGAEGITRSRQERDWVKEDF